ncbi:uncharacterized protein BO97DRAFT_426183 [Aspergillus homomorphus CBS 101889]|uniref:Uncharacterized protein n=1 Tax=Aspergillus homomorphus (strain CBS 101889) TaxID=1450537 RepID=A0A395HWR0_ASPHC|nr:hypothetical protein BO97DRAFT_426183 [Aspergillus homomorphus CBS 101889]RAL10674.1 hypothetical protein BO97DRAFT_426183 [Aspergillus homomorphus CBS 101889]
MAPKKSRTAAKEPRGRPRTTRANSTPKRNAPQLRNSKPKNPKIKQTPSASACPIAAKIQSAAACLAALQDKFDEMHSEMIAHIARLNTLASNVNEALAVGLTVELPDKILDAEEKMLEGFRAMAVGVAGQLGEIHGLADEDDMVADEKEDDPAAEVVGEMDAEYELEEAEEFVEY